MSEIGLLCFIKVSLVLVWKMAVRLVGRVWNSPKEQWRSLEEVWSY